MKKEADLPVTSSTWVSVIFLISIAAFGVFGWNYWLLIKDIDRNYRTGLSLTANIRRIMHLDEVLKMSARMLAASGDLSYEKRYKSYEPELDRIIKETLAQFTEDQSKEYTRETDEANQALVKMETRSFELVHQGRRQEAGALLAGAEYRRQKEIYARGMDNAFSTIQSIINQNLNRQKTHYFILFGIGLLGLFALLVAWVLYLYSLYKWIQERKQKQEQNEQLEKKLLQSEKTAAIGQLASGIAHEINNPLAIILGFSQSILSRMKPEDPLQMPLESIERETNRCKLLVQELLTFSRVGGEQKEKCNLNDLVHSTLSFIKSGTKMQGIDLVVELGNDIQPLVVNKMQIQQILINLCNNAIGAMPEGGRLTLRTRFVGEGDRPLVEIQVQDNGKGISEELQSKIFEPFFTTKEVGKGTGLGLSIASELIRKHDGTIAVQSRPGQGSLLIVQIPIQEG